MLYNSIQAFEEKVNALSIDNFYSHAFSRRGKPHYTEELGIEEGTQYQFGNEYSRRLLKRIAGCSEIKVMVYGRTVMYDEGTNRHEYEPTPQWLTIDCYSLGDGEYPNEHFAGMNEDAERCIIYHNDIDYFFIVPTQKPKNAVRYQP